MWIINMHYIIDYIHHATSHQYSARCDPKDLGPMALTTIDTHATSYHYTTKVAPAQSRNLMNSGLFDRSGPEFIVF